MRGNKYKISKKRRLRRRGKYSKKLKPKSRKSGGRLFGGHKKNKVKINATCDIPEFFFGIHELFWTILMSPSEVEVIQQLRQNGKINISVDGDLVSKTADKGDRTLSVNLSTAVIDKAFFDNVNEVAPNEDDNHLTIDLSLNNFDVTKKGDSYRNQGIDYSTYIPHEVTYFTCKDTNDNIMKLLLHLWRKTYNPFSPKDQSFKKFKDFFEDFTQYTDMVNQFREHTYNFQVVNIQLSSS